MTAPCRPDAEVAADIAVKGACGTGGSRPDKAATDALTHQLNELAAQKAVIDATVALDTARPLP